MKRLLGAALMVGVLVVAAALSGSQPQPASTSALQVQVEERNPWSHLRLNNEADTFRFAIVSDRTGGHRPQVFSQAVERLNLLQPEFVLSVGDLVEGYSKDSGKLAAEWREFQSYVCQLQMPFFYVPGNHDVSNLLGEKVWQEKFGRRYYHFLYKNVLFLILCADNRTAPAAGSARSSSATSRRHWKRTAVFAGPSWPCTGPCGPRLIPRRMAG
jgi:hypothetical protein